MKIIIIGGGVAGMAVAYSLSKNKNFKIELYEKEDQLGGQASSKFQNGCFVCSKK